MQPFLVLTGDLVESSKLEPETLDAAMDVIGRAMQEISGWRTDPGFRAGFGRRGGDGWQMVFNDPTLALRATLYVLAALRAHVAAVETRIAVATGEGLLPDNDDPNLAHGPAFTASGRALEGMDRHARLIHASGGAMGAAFRLADEIAQSWTQAQARAVVLVLPPNAGTRHDAAEHLGITRSAVNQALWSAGYRALSDAIDLLETETAP